MVDRLMGFFQKIQSQDICFSSIWGKVGKKFQALFSFLLFHREWVCDHA